MNNRQTDGGTGKACNAAANRDKVIVTRRWTEDKQIVGGGRLGVSVSEHGRRHCLVISDVQLSDAGQYVVKLTDHQPSVIVQSSTASLVVIPRQLNTSGTCSCAFGCSPLLKKTSVPIFLNFFLNVGAVYRLL